ncbi:MAG: hypothetical protein ACYTAS_20680, partial [Planctomycetota bacterium]
IIGCTGDWFGGWDGLTPGSVDRFITPDLKGGRLPQVIDKGEPAILVCHWPGIYYNGEEIGFNIFKEVVKRVHGRYDHLLWMKLSEIARYWAARELTRIQRQGKSIALQAPFATSRFTLRLKGRAARPPVVRTGAATVRLEKVTRRLQLKSGTWCEDNGNVIVCFKLPKGQSTVSI